MSFLMPSQRGFEHAQQELNDIPSLPNPVNRMQVSFDGHSYPSQSLPASTAPPPLQNGNQPSYPPDLPKVGQTRCCKCPFLSTVSGDRLSIIQPRCASKTRPP
jgi:hypothetical protein